MGSPGNHQKERQGWTEARDWYQQSVEAPQHIANPGIITSAGFEVGEPKEVSSQLAVCKAAIGRMKSSPLATVGSEVLSSPKALQWIPEIFAEYGIDADAGQLSNGRVRIDVPVVVHKTLVQRAKS